METKSCPVCGKTVFASTVYCPLCGFRFQPDPKTQGALGSGANSLRSFRFDSSEPEPQVVMPITPSAPSFASSSSAYGSGKTSVRELDRYFDGVSGGSSNISDDYIIPRSSYNASADSSRGDGFVMPSATVVEPLPSSFYEPVKPVSQPQTQQVRQQTQSYVSDNRSRGITDTLSDEIIRPSKPVAKPVGQTQSFRALSQTQAFVPVSSSRKSVLEPVWHTVSRDETRRTVQEIFEDVERRNSVRNTSADYTPIQQNQTINTSSERTPAYRQQSSVAHTAEFTIPSKQRTREITPVSDRTVRETASQTQPARQVQSARQSQPAAGTKKAFDWQTSSPSLRDENYYEPERTQRPVRADKMSNTTAIDIALGEFRANTDKLRAASKASAVSTVRKSTEKETYASLKSAVNNAFENKYTSYNNEAPVDTSIVLTGHSKLDFSNLPMPDIKPANITATKSTAKKQAEPKTNEFKNLLAVANKISRVADENDIHVKARRVGDPRFVALLNAADSIDGQSLDVPRARKTSTAVPKKQEQYVPSFAEVSGYEYHYIKDQDPYYDEQEYLNRYRDDYDADNAKPQSTTQFNAVRQSTVQFGAVQADNQQTRRQPIRNPFDDSDSYDYAGGTTSEPVSVTPQSFSTTQISPAAMQNTAQINAIQPQNTMQLNGIPMQNTMQINAVQPQNTMQLGGIPIQNTVQFSSVQAPDAAPSFRQPVANPFDESDYEILSNRQPMQNDPSYTTPTAEEYAPAFGRYSGGYGFDAGSEYIKDPINESRQGMNSQTPVYGYSGSDFNFKNPNPPRQSEKKTEYTVDAPHSSDTHEQSSRGKNSHANKKSIFAALQTALFGFFVKQEEKSYKASREDNPKKQIDPEIEESRNRPATAAMITGVLTVPFIYLLEIILESFPTFSQLRRQQLALIYSPLLTIGCIIGIVFIVRSFRLIASGKSGWGRTLIATVGVTFSILYLVSMLELVFGF